MRIDSPPGFSGSSDIRMWNSLTKWISSLYLQISGSFSHANTAVAKTATTNLLEDELGVVFLDSSSAAFTLTLPKASKIGLGAWYHFVKTDSSTNAITLDGFGSETINGAATNTQLDAQYDFMEIVSDGENWYISNIRSTM